MQKNEAAAVATREAKSNEKDQQCIGRRIVKVSELAKIFTACSVILSFRRTFIKTWYRNLYQFISKTTWSIASKFFEM